MSIQISPILPNSCSPSMSFFNYGQQLSYVDRNVSCTMLRIVPFKNEEHPLTRYKILINALNEKYMCDKIIYL